MLDTARLLFALGLPWLTGALFVMACSPSKLPGYRLLVVGMAFPLGMVGVISGYILLDRLGIGLQFGWNAALQASLAGAFGLVVWWRWPTVEFGSIHAPGEGWSELPRWGKIVLVCLLAWLGLRWVGIAVDVVHRPLFPWDAWYAYGNNAKVWFFYPHLEAFANGWQWFISDQGKWASGGTRHPPGIGLVQLWFAQALGRWDDALMNIGWPAAGLSLGLFMAGAVRLIGGHALVALGTVGLLLTLPVVDTQMTLAGYGDLWIGSLLAIAVGCIALARQSSSLVLLLPALVGITGMLLFKQTAQAWVPVLVLGTLAGWLRLRWIVLAGLAGLGVAVFGLWWLQETVRLSTLGSFGFNADGVVWPRKITMATWRDLVMWPDLLHHLMVYPNWHLFGYLLPALFLASWVVGWRNRAVLLQAVSLWGGLAVLIAAFSITSLGNTVIDGTSVNRLLLHFVPGLVLLTGWLLARQFPAPVVRKTA